MAFIQKILSDQLLLHKKMYGNYQILSWDASSLTYGVTLNFWLLLPVFLTFTKTSFYLELLKKTHKFLRIILKCIKF